ncbi:MAG: MFS transporter [Gammaproteobacteria bacterium]|nr:MFS transporter [Gammaproteobacteria bacterium]
MNASLNARHAVAMTGSERRAVATLALVLALRLFGLFVLLPVLALYAGDLPGATPMLAGLTVGAYGITQALFQVPAGLLSDRIGRKTVIVLGLFIFAAGSVVAALSDSITGIIIGRILQGAGAISAAVTALVSDLTRDEVRTRVMAIIGVSVGMAFLLALALGPTLSKTVGVSGLFWLGAILAFVAALAIVFGPGSWSPPARVAGVRLRDGLLNGNLFSLHLGVFLLHAILTATFVSVPYLLRDTLGIETGAHSRVYLLALLMSLAGTVPLILAVERLGRPGLVFGLAIGLLALAQFGLLGVSDQGGVIVAMAIFFAGFNFLEARLPARVSQLAEQEVRGGAFGVYATSQFLGAFVGGVAGGAILGAAGGSAVALVCAFAALLWMGVSAFQKV